MPTILQKNAAVLRRNAELLNQKDFCAPRLKKIIANMVTALEKEPDGVAIAAPQIGTPLRIFVVSHRAFEFIEAQENKGTKEQGNSDSDLQTQTTKDSLPTTRHKIQANNLVFINPEIIKSSHKRSWIPEGCLSVRGLYGEVSRADKVTVRAYNELGKIFTRGGSGLLAQIFQHETDHLNGILFIDTARNIEEVTHKKVGQED